MLTPDASPEQINQAMNHAMESFPRFRSLSSSKRAQLLFEIRKELCKCKDPIISTANRETSLGEIRLTMEFNRTISEIERFAKLCDRNIWGNFKYNLETKDIAYEIEMLPVGPVVVIGACNFPLAISVVGTDTISALMVGCPVVVKSHPGHPKTCQILADAVTQAVEKTQSPRHCFCLLHGKNKAVAQALVRHKHTKSVAFTGSLTGGKALHELSQKRKRPIPFYGEMGSLNPLFILPGMVRANTPKLADDFIRAVNLFAGQMCTKPGAMFVLEKSMGEEFIRALAKATSQAEVLPMLSEEIQQNYIETCRNLRNKIHLLSTSGPSKFKVSNPGIIQIFKMKGSDFLQNPDLRTEAFGPSSILVTVKDEDELLTIANSLEGSLTASIHSHASDHELASQLFLVLSAKVGRLLHNGFPPGVVPGRATHHGGPWPATTDARFTSIGEESYKRFLRPVLKQRGITPSLRD